MCATINRFYLSIHSKGNFFFGGGGGVGAVVNQLRNWSLKIQASYSAGQFKVLLQHLKSHPSKGTGVSAPTISRIERLQKVAGLVSDEALPYIATFTPQYYEGMPGYTCTLW